MTRTFPTGLRAILADVGQAAVEVECGVEGFREFVTLFRCETSRMINVERRFPYLHGKEILFRLMRFRVDAELIREDRHVSMEDLLDLQSLYLPTEEAAVSILEHWQVSLESLLAPGATAIPV